MIITRKKGKRLIHIFSEGKLLPQVVPAPYFEAEQKIEGLYYIGLGNNMIEAIKDCLEMIKLGRNADDEIINEPFEE